MRNNAETSKIMIARKVRELRKGRRWTQAELAERLGLSQSRLSEVERGSGSFTAEQFLVILKIFNVSVTHFVSERKPESELQNALARLGAQHLRESPDVLPSALLEQVADVVREVLVSAESSRHVTSLAPVVVHNINRLNLRKLRLRLSDVGAERRLGWLLANTLEAVQRELLEGVSRSHGSSYRRAKVILGALLDTWHEHSRSGEELDVLDADILSAKTLSEVRAASSPISRHWGIVTALQPEDFAAALRASRASA